MLPSLRHLPPNPSTQVDVRYAPPSRSKPLYRLLAVLSISLLVAGCLPWDDDDDNDQSSGNGDNGNLDYLADSHMQELSDPEFIEDILDGSTGDPRLKDDRVGTDVVFGTENDQALQAFTTALTHQLDSEVAFPAPGDVFLSFWDMVWETFDARDDVSNQGTVPCDEGDLRVSWFFEHRDNDPLALVAWEYNDCTLSGVTYTGELAASARDLVNEDGKEAGIEDRFFYDLIGKENGQTVYSVLGSGVTDGIRTESEDKETFSMPLLEVDDPLGSYRLAQDFEIHMEFSEESEERSYSGRLATAALGGVVQISTPTPLKFTESQSCPVSGELLVKDTPDGDTTVAFLFGDTTGTGKRVAIVVNDEAWKSYADCAGFNGHTGDYPGFLVPDEDSDEQVLRVASITIDGDPDDWHAAAVAPLATDPRGDQQEGGSPATDLVAFYAAVSGDYLAMMMQTDGDIAFPHTPGNQLSEYIKRINLFTDASCSNDDGGYLLATHFTDSDGHQWTELEVDWVGSGLHVPGEQRYTDHAADGPYLETAVPLAAIPDGVVAVNFMPFTLSYFATTHDIIHVQGCYQLPGRQ